ncbi:MAG: hypothetical protein HYV75_10420 [Opitutae bacterium]|nr:hypothetical protein [Opitutae bacterium]
MYNVSLVNLAADARTAADSLATVERPGLTDAELRALLRSFSGIDAVENAVAAPEIRVKVRNESYLIRTGQKRLLLYDVVHRELPALVLTLDEIMAELDGSALAARTASAVQSPTTGPTAVSAPPFPSAPGTANSAPRLIVMGLVACLLVGANIWLKKGGRNIPVLFRPVAPAEAAELQSSLAGVYMTGNQPGQHGIVFIGADDLKLFELSALGAPRVVYASGKLGRIGRQLALATDQPGGVIEVTDRDTLTYCGEVYRRVP